MFDLSKYSSYNIEYFEYDENNIELTSESDIEESI